MVSKLGRQIQPDAIADKCYNKRTVPKASCPGCMPKKDVFIVFKPVSRAVDNGEDKIEEDKQPANMLPCWILGNEVLRPVA